MVCVVLALLLVCVSSVPFGAVIPAAYAEPANLQEIHDVPLASVKIQDDDGSDFGSGVIVAGRWDGHGTRAWVLTAKHVIYQAPNWILRSPWIVITYWDLSERDYRTIRVSAEYSAHRGVGDVAAVSVYLPGEVSSALVNTDPRLTPGALMTSYGFGTHLQAIEHRFVDWARSGSPGEEDAIFAESQPIVPGRTTRPGDSGGPVVVGDYVVGVVKGIQARLGLNVSSILQREPRLMGLVSGVSVPSVSVVGGNVSVSWGACSSLAGEAVGAGGCSLLSGWRVFWKRAGSGVSWVGAQYRDLSVAAVSWVPTGFDVLSGVAYQVTVLPVDGDGKLVGSSDGKWPDDGDGSNGFVMLSTQYAVPSNTRVDVGSGVPAGKVRVSWDASSRSSDAPLVKGYKVFVHGDGGSGGWNDGSTPLEVDGSKTSAVVDAGFGAGRVTVLPVLADGTVFGAGPDGYPLPGNGSNTFARFGAPEVSWQGPGGEQTEYGFVGQVGVHGVSVAIDHGDGASYQWVYSASKDGSYSSGGQWGFTAGSGNDGKAGSPVLLFGVKGKTARAADSGWYKVRVSNSLGSTESKPMHVMIGSPFTAQSPAAGAAVFGWTGQDQQARVHVVVSAPSQEVVWERASTQGGTYSASGSWTSHSKSVVDAADSRNVDLWFNQSSTSADSGWYRARVLDGDDGTELVSDPMQVILKPATSGWMGPKQESGKYDGGHSDFTCPAGEVFIGRQHRGDENGDTWTRCAYLQIGAQQQIAVADSWDNSNTVVVQGKESRSGYDGTGECPANTWIIARQHYGDENGNTKTWCARAYAGTKQAHTTNNYWPAGYREYDGTVFTCQATNGTTPKEWDNVGTLTRGMTRRLHWKDENGPTENVCSEPYIP